MASCTFFRRAGDATATKMLPSAITELRRAAASGPRRLRNFQILILVKVLENESSFQNAQDFLPQTIHFLR